jgi:hypothetical protein
VNARHVSGRFDFVGTGGGCRLLPSVGTDAKTKNIKIILLEKGLAAVFGGKLQTNKYYNIIPAPCLHLKAWSKKILVVPT